MATFKEVKQEVDAFYKSNGIDDLIWLLIISVACLLMILSYVFNYSLGGWFSTILTCLFASAIFFMIVVWGLALTLIFWLMYYRKNPQNN